MADKIDSFSDQLYSTPTHFLFELVQNADDLDFEDDVTPRLALVHRRDGFLWVGCNEIGFTKDNVHSICRLKSSTKGVRNGQKDHIGEKGIGFKSVFKVADRVWISSHPYHFRFDRDARLGIGTPIWDNNFPSISELCEQTMFCLRIPKSDDRSAVQTHLLNLQAELPLFLRNVHEIQVVFLDTANAITSKFIVKREPSRIPSANAIVVKKDFGDNTESVKLRLIIEEYTQMRMPREERRMNVSQSKLQMGFPIHANSLPDLRDRDLYNFLPVRSYGLPFLLNGDFLLSANREDVEQRKPWNEALVGAAVDLFVQSAHRFNREVGLKYTWPRFAKSQGSLRGTFDTLLPSIVARLRSERVLESYAGTFELPPSLCHVPMQFTDGKPRPTPLMVIGDRPSKFLNSEYSYQDVSHLGVKKVDMDGFLWSLWHIVRDYPDSVHTQPQEWHSRVAQAITNGASRNDVTSIAIIPLRDGTWTSAWAGDLYFPELDQGLEIPDGINVHVIDENAAQDPHRRRLYQWLGAKKLTIAEVCELVLYGHEEHESQNWNRSQIISHAWYLFRASKTYRLEDPRRLRLAEQGADSVHHADKMYISLQQEYNITEFFPDGLPSIHILDRAYVEKAPDNLRDEWIKWLQGLGMWCIPRLAYSTHVSLAPEFRRLLDGIPSQRFLQLLRANWDIYYPYLNDEVLEELEEALVECLDGSRRPLKEVFLPIPALLNEPLALNTLKFVDVEPADESWQNLSILGIGTRANLRFYASILKNIKYKEYLKPSKEQIVGLYSHVQRLVETMSSIPFDLGLEDSIFIPEGQPMWASAKDCVWSAPSSFRYIPVLSRHYPEFAPLFSTHLRVRDARVLDVVTELLNRKGQVSLAKDMKDLLKSLNSFLRSGKDHQRIDRLSGEPVFPIRIANGSASLGSLNSSSVTWFIADRERLRACFANKLNLLDFSPHDIERLAPLVRRFGLQDRFLSEKVIEETLTLGELRLAPSTQYTLRSKADFMSRLVTRNKRESMKAQLSRVVVFSTPDLILRRTIKVSDGQEVHDDDVGRVRLRADSDRITIYLNADDTVPGSFSWYHISEELCKFFEIPKGKSNLAISILATDNEDAIEDMLERNDILPDPEPAARTDQDDFNYNADSQSLPPVRHTVTPATPTASQGLFGTSRPATPSLMSSLFGSATPVTSMSSVLGQSRPTASTSSSSDLITSATPTPPQGVFGSARPVSDLEALSPSPVSRGRRSPSRGAPASPGVGTSSPSPIPAHASSRSSLGPSSASINYVIDPSRIAAAAQTFRSERIVGVTVAEVEASPHASSSLLAFSASQAISPDARETRRSQILSDQSFPVHTEDSARAFNFDDLQDALPSAGPATPPTQRSSRPFARHATPSPRSSYGGGYEQEIGYGGELFVFMFLQRFNVSSDCWTSNNRSRYGLPAFSGLERDHSDFTVGASNVTQAIIDWLEPSGFEEARTWNERNMTYHFEVKTTTGECGEAFMMSNNQLDLSTRMLTWIVMGKARQWHQSPDDVYIILRVYNITSEPRFIVYIDPFAQMVTGKLRFDAREGYAVRPS
ncbi:MAG: hypothetical protein M1822_002707 [Bathelium mastoideum]|nr:MAG: hypothetical protein M1822_002707 [Bathelium mastoideum]